MYFPSSIRLKQNWAELGPKVKVGKIKTKTLYLCFSIAHSLGWLEPDMEFVKKFTQARFLKNKCYPKVRKSEWTQDRDKTA